MATDAAGTLFHRAVMQSGVLPRFPSREITEAAADIVVNNLGLTSDTIEQIRSVPVEELRKAATDSGAGTAPSIDGRLLTRHPFLSRCCARRGLGATSAGNQPNRNLALRRGPQPGGVRPDLEDSG